MEIPMTTYYEANKESVKEYQKNRRKNLDKRKADMMAVTRCRAKAKGREFNIKWTDIEWPEYCPLLNVKINYQANSYDPTSPSIDRIDSSKGYTKENCWVISRKANTIKSDATLEEILTLARNLEKYL
jgi:hypothetical protein